MTKARERGFTLIEVLAAFAILALSLGIIFNLWTSSVRRASIDAKQAIALRIAQSLLDEQLAIRSSDVSPLNGTTGNGYTWHIDKVLYANPNPITGFSWRQTDTKVTVSWNEYYGQQAITLSSVMFTPP